MSETKDFHIGTILSITTPYLLAPNLIHDVYEILDYMTGDSNYTHQLPRVANECKPYLLEQHPALRDVDEAWLKAQNYDDGERGMKVLREIVYPRMIVKFGEFLPVRPIHPEDHEVVDPTEELKRLRPDIEPLVIQISQDEPPSPTGDINWKVD